MTMDLPWLFLFSSLTIAFLLIVTVAQQVLLYHFCLNQSGNFTGNTTYQTNLDRLLSSFTLNTSNVNGFYNFSSGQGSNVANALAICRGDVNSSDYFTCINNANDELRNHCPYQREALASLLNNLTNNASLGTSLGKFSTGSALLPFQAIYALVQCTPDLTKNECSYCLSQAIREIP
ncbi:hypothetical protein Gohar_000046 [Gossypium harknessii]|uniref:Gnk2-homologous domain-containing protein n=1 Tax=Gossypium harknessii TaxID=34285 RepID=A0A7J9ID83_9ROSI|nr:hypothetical protein [Gossypium harknessii]